MINKFNISYFIDYTGKVYRLSYHNKKFQNPYNFNFLYVHKQNIHIYKFHISHILCALF